MNPQKREKLKMLFIVVACGCWLILNGALPIIFGSVVYFGEVTVAVSSLCGLIQVVVFFNCILLITIDYEKGAIYSYCILGVSLLGSVKAAFMTTTFQSIPGVFYCILMISIVFMMSRQVKKNAQAAVTDFVTELLNREGIGEEISTRIQDGKPCQLVSIRLKNVYSVSDSLGFEYGDMVLKMAGDRIQRIVGKEIPVGRSDASIFRIVLPGDADAHGLTSRLIFELTRRMVIYKNGTSVNCHVSAYAGIAKYPEQASNATELIKYSDIAMRKCVEDQREYMLFFDSEMETEYLRQAIIENQLKEAMENKQFFLVYQPQYSTQEKRIRGFETLLRMKLKNGELLSPGIFIPIAEKTDLIMHVDRMVLSLAMTECTELVKKSKEHITLSINVSAKSIASIEFAPFVLNLLEETGFPADSLEIEITEYSFAESFTQTEININRLREIGVKIALDDFGTGYTSLSQLVQLSLDLLKIDKSLIDDIENSQITRDFVDSVIYMGHLMNCEVLSEGVETLEQLQILRGLKCDVIQGFFWGKPMKFDEAKRLLDMPSIESDTEG